MGASGQSKMMMHCKDRTLVGEVLSIDILQKLDTHLELIEEIRMEIRYIGGFKVMLTFETTLKSSAFLDSKDVWSKISSSLVIWHGQVFDMERITWINVHGVPPQAWDTDTFNQIGSSLGRVVFLCEADIDDADLSSKQIEFSLKAGDEINHTCKVKWKGNIFRVRLSECDEVWIPEFLKMDSQRNSIHVKGSSEKNSGSRIGNRVDDQFSGDTSGGVNEEAVWGEDILEKGATLKVNEGFEVSDSGWNDWQGDIQIIDSGNYSQECGPISGPNHMKPTTTYLGPFSPCSNPLDHHVQVNNNLRAGNVLQNNTEDSNPFSLNDLIFNWGKDNNKKRKRKGRSPSKTSGRDRCKKYSCVTDEVGIKSVKRKKIVENHLEDNSGSFFSKSKEYQRMGEETTVSVDTGCESMDLNKIPKVKGYRQEEIEVQADNNLHKLAESGLEKGNPVNHGNWKLYWY